MRPGCEFDGFGKGVSHGGRWIPTAVFVGWMVPFFSGRRGKGKGGGQVRCTARTEEEDGAGVVAERINESDVHVYCGFEEEEEICETRQP